MHDQGIHSSDGSDTAEQSPFKQSESNNQDLGDQVSKNKAKNSSVLDGSLVDTVSVSNPAQTLVRSTTVDITYCLRKDGSGGVSLLDTEGILWRGE